MYFCISMEFSLLKAGVFWFFTVLVHMSISQLVESVKKNLVKNVYYFYTVQDSINIIEILFHVTNNTKFSGWLATPSWNSRQQTEQNRLQKNIYNVNILILVIFVPHLSAKAEDYRIWLSVLQDLASWA